MSKHLTATELARQQRQHDKQRNSKEMLELAGRMYDPERHDPDSLHFDDSYTGPSERELMGGCNRCGGLDDCYCLDD